MNILHICNFSPTRISGIAVAVLNLANAQAKLPVINRVQVVNLGATNKGEAKSDTGSLLGVVSTSNASVEELIKTSDLVHFHGVYQLAYPMLGRQCVQLNIPYVVCPHSSLMRAAMRTSWIKKTLSNWFLFDSFVKKATAQHFLTPEEAVNSRFGGLPFFVAGNAIEIPEHYQPASSYPLKICYIGRFDVRHKGLDILVQGIALSQKALRTSGATVHLYGPDHYGGKKQTARKIQQLQLGDLIHIHDSVAGATKQAAFSDSNLFVHTSRYEGQPQAVLEAWSYGRATLLTPGTNLVSPTRDHQLGWVAAATPRKIAEVLESILTSKDEVQRRGELARRYAESNLTQVHCLEQVMQGYQKVLRSRMDS